MNVAGQPMKRRWIAMVLAVATVVAGLSLLGFASSIRSDPPDATELDGGRLLGGELLAYLDAGDGPWVAFQERRRHAYAARPLTPRHHQH